ncbi:MAG: hypothetical protein JST38_13275 [Bacteroidetes bacterium]|nr:hypothetical protein [Bacteroidota bacterium]
MSTLRQGPPGIGIAGGRDPAATVVKRNIPSSDAVDELIALIKDGGDWVEPE